VRNLTVVITNSGRPKHLWNAFKSVIAAGLKNIVITSAPVIPEVKAVHKRIQRAYPAVRIVQFKDDPGCNRTWLEGVKAAKTEWVHILHDDDILNPEFAQARIEPLLEDINLGFVMFDSGSHDADSKDQKVINKQVDLWGKNSGLFACSSLQRRLVEADLSISPVSGIFRKSLVVSALSEFQVKCAHKKEFQYRPKMQVGNDLLIWLRASELTGYFYYLKSSLVSYGSHGGSTTCSDIAGAKRLPAIYTALKAYWMEHRLHVKFGEPDVRRPNIATFVYLPDPVKAEPFLKHLGHFKAEFPVHVLTDSDYQTVFPSTHIPKIGPFKERHGVAAPDQYAFIAFLRTIERANELGLDHFILIESDCRFTVPFWDAKMWDEFQAWGPFALFGGTPVCWHPWAQGEAVSRQIISYAYRYQQASGVAMAFEGAHNSSWGTAIYPNGALAIYSVKECLEYFSESMLSLKQDAEAQSNTAAKFHAFDLHVGRSLVRKYGVKGALKRMAFLPSVYSGCKDHHVTLTQRMQMLNSMKKVAVHQIK
jgi:hypothetical protein